MVLLLIRGVHFEAKKLLKQLALILKSDSSLLLIRRGGIIGTFFPLKNLSKIDQYVLELALESLSFWANRLWQSAFPLGIATDTSDIAFCS